MEFHPVADIFPLMEGQAFLDLCDDIEENGLREPIWLCENRIIDGRNRYRACKEVGATPSYREYEGDLAGLIPFVLSLNLHRRHLSEGQRAMVAAKVANLTHGQRADLARDANLHVLPVTRDEAAGLLNVSPRSVATAKSVLESAKPETIKAVESGGMAPSLAAKVIELPEEDQELIEAMNEEPAKMRELARDLVHNHRAQGTGENEWYTPAEYVETVRKLFGKIDLDPASSKLAQNVVQAERFFTQEDNGLNQTWSGKVWLNPPYAQPAIAQFITKMVEEWVAGNVEEAIVLTHNYTDTAWFHTAANACDAICFTRGRIGFLSPEGKKAAPTQGQAFFYFGPRSEMFRDAFAEIGFVVVAA